MFTHCEGESFDTGLTLWQSCTPHADHPACCSRRAEPGRKLLHDGIGCAGEGLRNSPPVVACSAQSASCPSRARTRRARGSGPRGHPAQVDASASRAPDTVTSASSSPPGPQQLALPCPALGKIYGAMLEEACVFALPGPPPRKPTPPHCRLPPADRPRPSRPYATSRCPGREQGSSAPRRFSLRPR